MKKSRSPIYPRKSLPILISRLRKYNVGDENYSEENLAQKIGFSGITGASIPYLSSLKRFDLLEQINTNAYKFRSAVFDLMEISTDKSVSEEKIRIIEQVAFTPDVFSDLRKNFGKSFPDRNDLVSFLKIYGFTNSSIPTVIESYQQTFDFIVAFDDSYDNKYDAQSLGILTKNLKEERENKLEKNNVNSATQQIYKLSDKINLIVKIVGFPHAEDIEKLNRFLEYNKELIEFIEDN